MKTSYYDTEPAIMEAVGNGSYVYRWGIEEVTVEENAGKMSWGTVQWKCFEVIVWATVTRNKITEEVLSAMWPADIEAKLLNDYNAAVLGVLDESYIERYREFLAERKAIKEQIMADSEALSIV